MSLNSVKDEILSPRNLDEPESARKRMRLDHSNRQSWSLSDKKTDQDVLLEMGVSLLEPDDMESACELENSLTKSGSKRKHDLENVNPNVNSGGKTHKSPKRSPKSKLWSPTPGTSALSPDSLELALKSESFHPHIDEDTPEAQLARLERPRPRPSALVSPSPSHSPSHSHSPSPAAVAAVAAVASSSNTNTQTPGSADAFSTLSDEVMLGIFRWMSKRTLAHCMLVCKRWHRIARDETFWQRLELGNRSIGRGALARILDRKPVIVRLAGSEIGEWHPTTPLEPCRIQYLDLSMCSVDRQTLAALLARCSLVKLSLEANNLDDHICTLIGKSTKMESLNLTMASGISEKGLTAILNGCTSLVSLNVSWCALAARALVALSRLTPSRLQRLNCAGARLLTDDVLADLLTRCPRLIELDISDSARLTGSSLTNIMSMSCLQHLAISRLYLLPPAALTKLGSMPSLQYLEVWGLLQDASLPALKAALPAIQINQFMHSAIARPTVGTRRTSIWGLRTRD